MLKIGNYQRKKRSCLKSVENVVCCLVSIYAWVISAKFKCIHAINCA